MRANRDARTPGVPFRVSRGVEEGGEDERGWDGDLDAGVAGTDGLGGWDEDGGEGFGGPSTGNCGGWGGHWERVGRVG